MVLECDTSKLVRVWTCWPGLMGKSLRYKYLLGVYQWCCSWRFSCLISLVGVDRYCSCLLFLNSLSWVVQFWFLGPYFFWSCLGSVGLGRLWRWCGLIFPLDIPRLLILLLFSQRIFGMSLDHSMHLSYRSLTGSLLVSRSHPSMTLISSSRPSSNILLNAIKSGMWTGFF